MSVTVTLHGRCGVERRTVQRALLDADLGCRFEPDHGGLYHVRYAGLMITLSPCEPRPFYHTWEDRDPLRDVEIDVSLSIDIPRSGSALVRDVAIVRLAAWLVVRLPGTWVLGYDTGAVQLVHARGETALFHEAGYWLRGQRTDVLDAMPLRHRWGGHARHDRLTWDPSGTRRDYARLAELVRADRPNGSPASMALAAAVERAQATALDLGVPLPEDYAVCLSLSDGLKRDRLLLHDSGEGDSSSGIATLVERERSGANDVLVLGEAGPDILGVDPRGRAFVRRRTSGEVAAHASVLDMLIHTLERSS